MSSSADLYSTIQGLSPLLHYPLTETSGTVLTNAGSLGTACNLTLTGSYTRAERQLISGDSTAFLKLNGGYATGSKGALPLPLTNMTLSVVLEIFPGTPLAQSPRIFTISASGDAEAQNAQALFGFDATTLIPISFHENGSGVDNSVSATQTTALAAIKGSANSKLHLTIVRDATSKVLNFYYNGALISSFGYDANPTGGSSTTVYLGTEQDLRPSHPMAIGHMCLWNRVLSKSELFNLHTASGYSDQSSADYLGFDIQTADQTRWGTLESIQEYLKAEATKRLSIAVDPLLNPEIVNPEEAYSFD
jgi:hypothetical protein